MHPLDQPIWGTLNSTHKSLAIGNEKAKGFPRRFGPFAGLESSDDIEDLLPFYQVGDTLAFATVGPKVLSNLEVTNEFIAFQYVYENPQPANMRQDPRIRSLTFSDVPAALELTDLVYPHYFRSGSLELGRYYGVFESEKLIAMAGLRFQPTGFQEISCVCTHPDFRGMGLAGNLTLLLINEILLSGNTPFLHTEEDNLGAQSLYEKIGFSLRSKLPVRVVKILDF